MAEYKWTDHMRNPLYPVEYENERFREQCEREAKAGGLGGGPSKSGVVWVVALILFLLTL